MAARSGSRQPSRLDGVSAPAQGHPWATGSSWRGREEPLTRGGSWREARTAALGSFSALSSQMSRRAADDSLAHAFVPSSNHGAPSASGWHGAAHVDDLDELFSGDALLEASAQAESCGSLDNSVGSESRDFGAPACCCAAASEPQSDDRGVAMQEQPVVPSSGPGGYDLTARESTTEAATCGLTSSREHRLEGPIPSVPRRLDAPVETSPPSPVVTSASALAALAGGERPSSQVSARSATACERGCCAAIQAQREEDAGARGGREARAATAGCCAGSAMSAGTSEAAGCPGVPCCAEATHRECRRQAQPRALGHCSPELEAGSDLMVISTSKHADEDFAESSEDWEAEELSKPPVSRQPVSTLVRRSGSRMPLPTSISFCATGCSSTARRGLLGTRPPPLQQVGDEVAELSATSGTGFCSPPRAAPTGRSGMGRTSVSHGNMHACAASGSGASPASSAASTIVGPVASKYPCTDGSVASRTMSASADRVGHAPLLEQPDGGSDLRRSPRSAREQAMRLAHLAATPQLSDYPDERAALSGGSAHVAVVESTSVVAATSGLPAMEGRELSRCSEVASAASAPLDLWDLYRTPRDR